MKTPWGLARENAALQKLLADTVSQNESLVAKLAQEKSLSEMLVKRILSLEGKLKKFNRPRSASGKFMKAGK